MHTSATNFALVRAHSAPPNTTAAVNGSAIPWTITAAPTETEWIVTPDALTDPAPEPTPGGGHNPAEETLFTEAAVRPCGACRSEVNTSVSTPNGSMKHRQMRQDRACRTRAILQVRGCSVLGFIETIDRT